MKDKFLKIINHYGVNPQQRKFAEEAFELQEAITTYETCLADEWNNPLSDIVICGDRIAEEIADCLVLLNQFKEYYEISDKEINRIIEFKVDRQIKRIEENK